MKKKFTYLFEIVKTFELQAISAPPEEEEWKFRIEILKKCTPKGMYSARVTRRETYRISPTYPLTQDGEPLTPPCDKEIIVDDTSSDWERIKGRSPDSVLYRVLKEFERIFEISVLDAIKLPTTPK
jgi:hypothetical protein